MNLFWQPVNGTSGPERLLTSPNVQYADAFSPDGRELGARRARSEDEVPSVRVLSMDGTHASKPLVRTPFNETKRRTYRPTAGGLRISQTSRGEPKCTCGRIPT